MNSTKETPFSQKVVFISIILIGIGVLIYSRSLESRPNSYVALRYSDTFSFLMAKVHGKFSVKGGSIADNPELLNELLNQKDEWGSNYGFCPQRKVIYSLGPDKSLNTADDIIFNLHPWFTFVSAKSDRSLSGCTLESLTVIKFNFTRPIHPVVVGKAFNLWLKHPTNDKFFKFYRDVDNNVSTNEINDPARMFGVARAVSQELPKLTAWGGVLNNTLICRSVPFSYIPFNKTNEIYVLVDSNAPILAGDVSFSVQPGFYDASDLYNLQNCGEIFVDDPDVKPVTKYKINGPSFFDSL